MYRLASIVVTAALLLSADASGLARTPRPGQVVNFSSDENHPVLQATPQRGDQGQPAHINSPDNPGQQTKAQNGPLQPASRLSLVRYVDGELVQIVRSI